MKAVADLEILKGGSINEEARRKILLVPRPLPVTRVACIQLRPHAYWESPVLIISTKRKIVMFYIG